MHGGELGFARTFPWNMLISILLIVTLGLPGTSLAGKSGKGGGGGQGGGGGDSLPPDWNPKIVYKKDGGIYVVDPDYPDAPRQVSFDCCQWSFPSWSPDGKEILVKFTYVITNDDSTIEMREDLVRIPIFENNGTFNPKPPRRIVQLSPAGGAGLWSPVKAEDGSYRIAYLNPISPQGSGKYGLYLVNPDDVQPCSLANVSAHDISWKDESGEDCSNNIPPTPQILDLTGLSGEPGEIYFAMPTWSPDGEKLAFPVVEKGIGIVTFPLDADGKLELTAMPTTDFASFDWIAGSLDWSNTKNVCIGGEGCPNGDLGEALAFMSEAEPGVFILSADKLGDCEDISCAYKVDATGSPRSVSWSGDDKHIIWQHEGPSSPDPCNEKKDMRNKSYAMKADLLDATDVPIPVDCSNVLFADGGSLEWWRGLCGNGVEDRGEGCDDGNTDPGDGCSDTCTLE